MKSSIIYALRDPNTDEYRYIGKSNNGISRAKSHLTYSHNFSVNYWVNELRNDGMCPEIDVLEECEEDELLVKEKFWIRYYESVGCRLFNKIKYLGQTIDRLRDEVEKEKANIEAERLLLESELNKIKDIRLEIKTIPGFIKNRRKALNVTQEALAEIAGVSPNTVYLMENGRNPNIDTVLKLLDVLGYELQPVLKTTPAQKT